MPTPRRRRKRTTMTAPPRPRTPPPMNAWQPFTTFSGPSVPLPLPLAQLPPPPLHPPHANQAEAPVPVPQPQPERLLSHRAQPMLNKGGVLRNHRAQPLKGSLGTRRGLNLAISRRPGKRANPRPQNEMPHARTAGPLASAMGSEQNLRNGCP